MRLRSVTVREGHEVALEADPSPSPDWREDGVIRWLNVEAATHGELVDLFDRLGSDGTVIADYITEDHSPYWIEREEFTATTRAAPTAWRQHEAWFHLVGLPQTIVTVHGVEVPGTEAFIRRCWLGRPRPDVAIDAVLLKVIQSYVEEENDEFHRIRLQIERHAEGLKRGDSSFTVELLEELMTRCNHMGTVYFEYQRLCEGIEFVRSRVVGTRTHQELFRQGVANIRSMREGVEQLQRRLEELQRQHLMDRQALMERRIRVLTILSAIFLPLTLIAGVYGMNFHNMPELDEGYAYFVVLAGMALVGITMLTYFFWKGWFR